MFSQISDKLLQINLYSWSTIVVGNLAGIINTSNWGEMLTYDEVMRFAAIISAISGAVYGAYRVGDLVAKLIKYIEERYVKNRNRRKRRK